MYEMTTLKEGFMLYKLKTGIYSTFELISEIFVFWFSKKNF